LRVIGLVLALGLTLAPLVVEAQPPTMNVPRVGVLMFVPRTKAAQDDFRRGFREQGYVEGQDIVVESHSGKLVPPANISSPLQYRVRASAPQDGPLTRCAISLTVIRNGGLGHEITERVWHPVLTIVLASAWGCASTATKEGTGEYVDDSVITTKVKTAIFNDATLKVNEINVETFKGVAQRCGRLPGYGDHVVVASSPCGLNCSRARERRGGRDPS
jgi:hypothetical protein